MGIDILPRLKAGDSRGARHPPNFPKRGYKFKTPEEAWNNASDFVERCAEIVSERARSAQGEAE